MNNNEVCNQIKKRDKKIKYFSDQCVSDGYGQSCGGYLTGSNKNSANILQADHFINYYEKKGDKLPSYRYLRCPQLLMFIAEFVGLKSEDIKCAYQIVKNYEDKNNLKQKQKNGNYMWGTEEFKQLKAKLKISEIEKIIKESEKWEDIIEKIKELNAK